MQIVSETNITSVKSLDEYEYNFFDLNSEELWRYKTWTALYANDLKYYEDYKHIEKMIKIQKQHQLSCCLKIYWYFVN